MYKPTVFLPLTVLCLTLAGCAATVWTTTTGSIRHNPYNKIRAFGPGEYPVFIIANASGKTVGLTVRDRRTDKVAKVSGDQRLHSQLEHIRMPDLRPGPYTVDLHVSNDFVDTWDFEIAKRDQTLGDEEGQEFLGTRNPNLRDPRLVDVVDGWRALPEESKKAIVAIVRAWQGGS